jgi:uncharacterized protein with PQ loop repeat
MTEIIGWIGSLILILTIGKQVYNQWSEGSSEGVSIWLFIGQIAASTVLGIYSFLIGNTVFIFTNSLLIITATLGLIIAIYQKKDDKDTES